MHPAILPRDRRALTDDQTYTRVACLALRLCRATDLAATGRVSLRLIGETLESEPADIANAAEAMARDMLADTPRII